MMKAFQYGLGAGKMKGVAGVKGEGGFLAF
jgi:hypothetical protein